MSLLQTFYHLSSYKNNNNNKNRNQSVKWWNFTLILYIMVLSNSIDRHSDLPTDKDRQKNRHIDRQTDRQTDREVERYTDDRHPGDRKTEREIDRINKQPDTHTSRQTKCVPILDSLFPVEFSFLNYLDPLTSLS